MKLLVLGGTKFVGRHLVLAAQAAGAEVTLFNRGRTNAGIFADLEHITGDRDGDLSGLKGRSWDAVLDVNGYVPRIVEASAEMLADSCDHYTYVSTVSVYGMTGTTAPDEDTPLTTLETPTEEVTGETYGALKAGCEDVVRRHFGQGRRLIVRPGFVVGPYDHTERFVRWVRRAADGGDMLAPGDPSGPMQFIDARDLADWTVRMLLGGRTGTYNAVRPTLPMAQVLQACIDVTAAGATLTWVDEDFLLGRGLEENDLPLWVPREDSGMLQIDPARAVEDGMTFRPLEDTVRATWVWDRARTAPGPAGLSAEREREVLAAWHAARG